MGIVRLAKCLKMLNSLDEYKNRKSDISNKIQGNRAYLDFVSIVYKIQVEIINELNYLLFSFLLIANDIQIEQTDKFLSLVSKYKDIIHNHQFLINSFKVDSDNLMIELNTVINSNYITAFKALVNSSIISSYVYNGVVDFVVDLLTNKISDVEHVLISFDGIPSFGKIQEQRQRRYMRYMFSEFQTIIEKEYIQSLDLTKLSQTKNTTYVRYLYDLEHFRSDIKSAIEYIYDKYHSKHLHLDISSRLDSFKRDGGVTVEVIDRTYGEGEKILMDLLLKDYQTFGDTKSYVFYSPDGDSVILCLNVYIKTKVDQLTVVKTFNQNPSEKHNESSQYVNIKNLYTNIVDTVQSMIKTDKILNKDQVNSDFILIMNFFGNDFIHQIPTIEISGTFMDIMYIYSEYIKNNNYLTYQIQNQNEINYQGLIEFIKMLADYENMLMLDTYMSDVDEKHKMTKYFGNLFTHRYLIDFREHVVKIKADIHNRVKTGELSVPEIKQLIEEGIEKLNQITTITNKKYGDIWTKIEIKNIDTYVTKILESPTVLTSKYPKFLYPRTKKKKNETELKELVALIETDLINHNKEIDTDSLNLDQSTNRSLKNFAFEYSNIRNLIPHEQMPTTEADLAIYSLDWRSGRWMHALNGYSYELGYDWKKESVKKLPDEMKRYQYDMLKLNNSQLAKMITDYLKTLSWMFDYYTNTDYDSTMTEISIWSFNYNRSPFLSHIADFFDTVSTNDVKNIMKNFYKKTLIQTSSYIKSDRHKFYVYPQSTQTINSLPDNYKAFFPDMTNVTNSTMNFVKIENFKGDRFFDCRLCPYFSKCVFKSKHITFRELMNLDINSYVQYKILQRDKPVQKMQKITRDLSKKIY